MFFPCLLPLSHIFHLIYSLPISVLLQLYIGAPPQPATSVPATAAVVGRPASTTEFAPTSTPLQASTQASPVLPQLFVGAPQVASTSVPSDAVLVEMPAPASRCDLIYTHPQAPMRETAGSAGHEAPVNPSLVYGPSFSRGTAKANSDLESLESVNCWPCQIKSRV